MSKDNKPVEKAPDAGGGKEETKVVAEVSPAIEPDWKDLLRLERERSEKAERDRDHYREGMLSYKGQLKAVKREVADEEPEELNEKIKRGVQEALSPVVEALRGNKVDQILASVVTDPSKREYVKALYQSRIQKTGNSDDAIRLDLEAAVSLADSSRFAKENEELRRMNDNKTYVPPAGGGGGGTDGKIIAKNYKWTPEQEAALEQRAMMNGITDVEKYKALAYKAATEGSAFDIKRKYI